MKEYKPPVAFLSYVNEDDNAEEGRITKLMERLSIEVKLQTGEEFHIFQDRKDIKWGEHWNDRIENSIDDVAFLIPVITPSYFKSTFCREELQRFLEKQKKLKHTDLILPVYYIRTPEIYDPVLREKDVLAKALNDAEFRDITNLRFVPLHDPKMAEFIADMAGEIIAAKNRLIAGGRQREGVKLKHKRPKILTWLFYFLGLLTLSGGAFLYFYFTNKSNADTISQEQTNPQTTTQVSGNATNNKPKQSTGAKPQQPTAQSSALGAVSGVLSKDTSKTKAAGSSQAVASAMPADYDFSGTWAGSQTDGKRDTLVLHKDPASGNYTGTYRSKPFPITVQSDGTIIIKTTASNINIDWYFKYTNMNGVVSLAYVKSDPYKLNPFKLSKLK